MLTGHSLGASTACVLSLLLYRDYPNLKCYLYEPVGCTMTLELAKFTEKYTISTVFGNDVIPRLSPHSIERLIASMVYIYILYCIVLYCISTVFVLSYIVLYCIMLFILYSLGL